MLSPTYVDEDGDLVRQDSELGVVLYVDAVTLEPTGATREPTGVEQDQIDAQRHEEEIAPLRAAAFAAADEAGESSRVAMRDLTDLVIDWCENVSAYLFGPTSGGVPQYGAITVHAGLTRYGATLTSGSPARAAAAALTYVGLLQQAETALLAFRALTERSAAVEDQQKWLTMRTQQATALLGLAKTLGAV